MRSTLHSLKFLFVGPMIVLLLFVINLMTAPGDWWVQWAAFGIGIAWVISLFRVIRAVVLAGGLAKETTLVFLSSLLGSGGAFAPVDRKRPEGAGYGTTPDGERRSGPTAWRRPAP